MNLPPLPVPPLPANCNVSIRFKKRPNKRSRVRGLFFTKCMTLKTFEALNLLPPYELKLLEQGWRTAKVEIPVAVEAFISKAGNLTVAVKFSNTAPLKFSKTPTNDYAYILTSFLPPGKIQPFRIKTTQAVFVPEEKKAFYIFPPKEKLREAVPEWIPKKRAWLDDWRDWS